MHFVDEVDFELSPSWRIGGVVPKIADIFHAVIAGSVDLNDVQASPFGNFLTHIANAAGLRGRAFHAVERLGQNASGGCLSNTPRAHKKISLSKSAGINRILQGSCNVILADNFGKRLRSILAGKNSVTHPSTLKPPPRLIQHDLKISIERKNTNNV